LKTVSRLLLSDPDDSLNKKQPAYQVATFLLTLHLYPGTVKKIKYEESEVSCHMSSENKKQFISPKDVFPLHNALPK